MPPLAASVDSMPVNRTVIPLVEDTNTTTLEPVGCRDPPQTWCSHVPRIYLYQYVLALLLVAMGYPTASLLCYSIYSKILGPFPQVTPSTHKAGIPALVVMAAPSLTGYDDGSVDCSR